MWAFARPADAWPAAADLAGRALALDPDLPEAHASTGLIACFYDWDWEQARLAFERAILLNPGSALTRLWNGHYLSIVARFEDAVTEMRIAQDLDPLSPVVSSNLGWTHVLAHDYDRAQHELSRVLARAPGNGLALFYLGYARTRRHGPRGLDECLARERRVG